MENSNRINTQKNQKNLSYCNMAYMKVLIYVLILLPISLFAQNSKNEGSDVKHIILIQNSGWMLPFYEDKKSKLKSIAKEISERILNVHSGEQFIVSFNQSYENERSPKLLYRGNDIISIQNVIRNIQAARKKGTKFYTDTDFKEAVINSITEFTPGKSAILWIITNNKNSPNNSQETRKKNVEYYNFIQNSKEIKRVVAFPYANKVISNSTKFTSNGLMIYGIAYGSDANKLLHKLVESGIPFGDKPARLKPLNTEALLFTPVLVEGENIKSNLGTDEKTLILYASADKKPGNITINGKLNNTFYPYDIESADINIKSEFKSEKVLGILSKKSISKLKTEESSDIQVTLKTPSISSIWNPEVIFGYGKQIIGSIYFELDNQKLEISKKFISKFNEIFPGDALPELFVPGESAQKSITNQPIILNIEYPTYPLIIMGVLIILLLGIIISLFYIFTKEKIYNLRVEGSSRRISIKPFRNLPLIHNNQKIGMIKRGFGKPIIILNNGKSQNVNIS